MGTLSKTLFALAMFAAPGCLGSDTDLTQPIDTGALANPKPNQSLHEQIINIAQTTVHDGIEQLRFGSQRCVECTVTVTSHFDGQVGEVVVYSDQTGEQLCTVTVGPTIRTDNCDVLNDDKSLAAM
jgi:hypothetical protein